MRVALVTRHRGLPVGFGTYATQLIDALARFQPEHDYVVIEPEHVPRLRSALVAWELTVAAARARRERADLVHYLYPAFPAVRLHAPVVVSVLDAIAFAVPGYELPAPYA